MINIENTEISKLYIGNTECQRVYQGGTLIYGDVPYITFKSNANGSTIGLVKRSNNQTTLEYSTDGINWTNMTSGMTPETIDSGEELYVRGILEGNNTSSDYTKFTVGGDVSVEGNINALWNYEDLFQPLFEYCGHYLFQENSGLTDANKLSLGYTNTTLNSYCYDGMFSACVGLENGPKLPATTLGYYCYGYMFYNCTSLTTAPELPATTLASYCYSSMFYNCASLTTAPELPANTLADWCYFSMFHNCASLTTAPELPSTALGPYCYEGMFFNCGSLTTAPELPATTLVDGCYANMFQGCSSLTTAPVLPATTLADWCYQGMFTRCHGLTITPELPATSLAEYCYSKMFWQSTGLTTVVELPSTTLGPYCYEGMFSGCVGLNYIKCLAVNNIISGWLSNWTLGVSQTGTFVKHPNATGWTTGASGIPSGWTVEDAT